MVRTREHAKSEQMPRPSFTEQKTHMPSKSWVQQLFDKQHTEGLTVNYLPLLDCHTAILGSV